MNGQLVKDKDGKEPLKDGDFVDVLAADKRQWRKAVKGATGFTFEGLKDGHSLTLSDVVRVAKAASVTVIFTRVGQSEPAGVWEGLAPTPEAITSYFKAQPSSDELARTLPVIVGSIQARTIHGGVIELVGGSDGPQPTNYEGKEDPVTDEKTGLVALEDKKSVFE